MTKPAKSKELVKVAASRREPVVAPVPDEIRRAFGPAPLFAGEDHAIYQAFYDGIREAMGPGDVLEELRCNQVVVSAWEALRWRRLKLGWLRSMAHTGVRAALSTVLDATEARSLTKAWANEEPEAIERVEWLLARFGAPSDVIAAHTSAVNIRVYSALNEMSMRADAHRHAEVREFDRHRAAKRAQQAYEDIEDAEYEVVSDPEPKEAA